MGTDEKYDTRMTRRDALKVSGLALGGLAIGTRVGLREVHAGEVCPEAGCDYPPPYEATQRYKYFEDLPGLRLIDPKTYTYIPPAPGEMRISFMGSSIPPDIRQTQKMMSIFVEVGPTSRTTADSFVFDCGSGVCSNYNSMGVSFGRMNKVFLTHLHGDHMSDLIHIYCFGAIQDRKSPLFVWGHGPSGVKSPRPPRRLYDDGTRAFCANLREACRWHSESQSFISTSYESYQAPTRESWGLPCEPRPVADDPPDDGYALIPIELDWTKSGQVTGDNVAYDNPETGVRITHFPVIHCRKGSIGYKLEWNGLSMVYTGDTKPEYQSIDHARGVDVFIHEMNPPAEVWAFKNMGLPAPPQDNEAFDRAVDYVEMVQNSSHTPQGAFGYVLGQISPRPRLTVATHFPVADDMVQCALNSVQAQVPDVVWGRDIIWSFDRMVLKITREKIEQFRGVVSDFAFQAPASPPTDQKPPKYWTYAVDENGDPVYDENGERVIVGDPYAQIDRSTEIPPEDEDGDCNYREDGY